MSKLTTELELEMFGETSMKTIEGAFSLFKRGVIGSYHHLSKDHLDSYLQEFLLAVQSPGNATAYVPDVDARTGDQKTTRRTRPLRERCFNLKTKTEKTTRSLKFRECVHKLLESFNLVGLIPEPILAANWTGPNYLRSGSKRYGYDGAAFPVFAATNEG